MPTPFFMRLKKPEIIANEETVIDSKMPLITIGIPTYNRADGYLADALESALAQTYPHFEIVVSDNASTDHTEDLVKGYKDPRIRYIKHPENVGFKNNFNSCIENARGDYFLLLCDDDLIDPDLLEVCMDKVDCQRDVGVILTGIRIIDETGNTAYESQNKGGNASLTDFFFNWFHDKVPLYLPSTLYNTAALRKIGMFNSKTDAFLDVVATVKIAASMGWVNITDVKASFRRHDSNTGGSPARINIWSQDCLYLLEVMCDLADPDRVRQLRQRGLWWFCRKNYRLAQQINNPLEKLTTFLKLNKMFENSYPPSHFVYNTKIRPQIRQIKAKVARVCGVLIQR